MFEIQSINPSLHSPQTAIPQNTTALSYINVDYFEGIHTILSNTSMNSTSFESMNISLETLSTGVDTNQFINVSIVIRIILYSLIFIACILGNTAVLFTLISSNRLKNVTNCFLINLALSDILLGVFCMPFTLIGSILKNFIFGSLMCKVVPYLQAVSVGVSAWTLVTISFERYFAICHPLESRRWQTMSHSYRVITIIWLANICLMSPIAIYSQLLPTQRPGKYKCREVWPSDTSEELFNLLLLVCLLVIPFIILISAYTMVSRELCNASIFQSQITNNNHNNNNYNRNSVPNISVNSESNVRNSNSFVTFNTENQSTNSISISYDCKSGSVNGINGIIGSTEFASNSRMKLLVDTDSRQNVVRVKKLRLGNSRRVSSNLVSKKRIIRMLCVLVFEFFICWTPIYVINVWAHYSPKQLYSIVNPSLISYIHLLSYLSSCTNPITYCFMHKKFREALMMILRNRGSTHIYLISELDQSSNQSGASGSTGASNHSNSQSGVNVNSIHLNQYNNNNSNYKITNKMFGSQLMSKFHIRNSVI